MKHIIFTLKQLPKWYGFGILFAYSFLLAEYFSEINHLMPYDISIESVFKVISKISYILTIISSIILWILTAFLFHLTALLFNGNASFRDFLFTTAYVYIIPACMIIVGISLIDTIQIPNNKDVIGYLMDDKIFKLAADLVNYSFLPYYLLVATIIHYVYQIKPVYSLLSVAIPVLSIWGIAELTKLI